MYCRLASRHKQSNKIKAQRMKSIEFKDITFGYRKNRNIFSDISFKITKPSNKGFVVGLMGNSGSGKTTIFRLLSGLETKYKGKVSITIPDPIISYVPQEPVLYEHLTPLENANYFKDIKSYRKKFKHSLFDELAKLLQVNDLLREAKSVNEISGGQRQKISLLRALSIQPDILLLDEPLTGLDEEVKDAFLQTLSRLIVDFDLLVIYITHHSKEIEFISDEIIYLIQKTNSDVVESIFHSTTTSFFSNPPTISALKSIKDISTNILHIKIFENNISFLKEEAFSSNCKNEFYMGLKEDVICFTNEDNSYKYNIIRDNGLYSLILIENSGIIINVRTEKIRYKNYVSFNGEVNLYDSNGLFSNKAKILNEKIEIL